MKRLISIMAMLAIPFFIMNCSASEKEKMEASNAKEGIEAEKQVPEEPVKVDHPKYEITVTQKGKEMGKILIETFPETAPQMCRNFDSLVTSEFYNGCAFHRVIPGFMIQGGDPNTKNKPKEQWGMGAPGQRTIPAEFSAIPHKRGILSTARKGNDVNSATSQFFIMVADAPQLDRQYTVFGKVLEGMEIADKIVGSPTESPDRPIDKIEMKITKK